MSDTPRTDKEAMFLCTHANAIAFAKTLEREINDLLNDTTYYIRKEQVEKLEKELAAMTKERNELQSELYWLKKETK